MTNKPILIFPIPEIAKRELKPNKFFPKIHKPTPEEQVNRLDLKIQKILRSQAALRLYPTGMQPENVLVFQTVGSIKNFKRAVEKAGLSWLIEFEGDELDASDTFYDERDKSNRIITSLYLVMTNQSGLNQILSLWQVWKSDTKATLRRFWLHSKRSFLILLTLDDGIGKIVYVIQA